MAINIKFPLEDDVNNNYFLDTSKTTKDALRSSLLLLLLTEKGERYYMPDYGTNLNSFIFDPKDAETLKAIEAEIKKTVGKYIPQLTISSVDFYMLEDETGLVVDENTIEIEIKFLYSNDLSSQEQTVIISRTQ
jgi:phage baseplate assembly protein W